MITFGTLWIKTTQNSEQLRKLLGIEAWPELDKVVSPDSGHSSHEPGITRELVAATNRVVRTGSPVRG